MAKVAIEALKQDLQDSLEITGSSNLNFHQVVSTINSTCGTNIKYISPFLVEFVIYNLSKGKKISYILVMILLHYLPRFSKNNDLTSTDFQHVTDCQPVSIEEFIRSNCRLFQSIKT